MGDAAKTAWGPPVGAASSQMRTVARLAVLLLFAPAPAPARLGPSISSGPTPATARQVSVDIVQLFWNYGSSQHGGAPGTPAEGRKAMKDAAAAGFVLG